MWTRAMILDPKSESHMHLATIERHGHRIENCFHKDLYSYVIGTYLNYESFLISFDEGMQLLFGGGTDTPFITYSLIIIFGCKWVIYSILWCQPCQHSFIWTYFPIAYTNKIKSSVLNHFLNMTDFDFLEVDHHSLFSIHLSYSFGGYRKIYEYRRIKETLFSTHLTEVPLVKKYQDMSTTKISQKNGILECTPMKPILKIFRAENQRRISFIIDK